MNIAFDDIDVYTVLLHVCHRHSVHPSSSLEAEDLFRHLLEQYSGEPNFTSLEAWLDAQIPQRFVGLTGRPAWIQDPEWPFVAGQPMVFVGQIDYKKSATHARMPALHDDTSFYVFIAPKSPPKVVMQQF